MRDLRLLSKYRLSQEEVRLYGAHGDDGNGIFRIPSVTDTKPLRVIVSNGGGWDHVSVSRGDRVPDYDEMQQIAKLVFRDVETAMQLHVPSGDHINFNTNCLHWWRPQNREIPRPPSCMVGPKS